MTSIRSLLKRPLYLLVPLVALALALWSFWPRPLPVEMVTVARAPLDVDFTEEGRTRLRQRYRVAAPTDGFLQRIVLQPGDVVHAGDTIALLQPASARLLDPAAQEVAEMQLRSAEHALAAAQASLDAARSENARRAAALVRIEALAARKLVSGADLDLARASAIAGAAVEKSAAAALQQSRAARDAARAALQLQGTRPEAGSRRRIAVLAPASGHVVQRYIESEGPVQAGQSLLDIGEPSDLEVEVEILSSDAVRIAPGTPVQLTRWGGDRMLPAHVRLIEPGAFTKVSALGVEEQRVKAIVDFDAPVSARQGLGDAFRVDARFLVWHGEATLQVPTAALFRDGGAWALYRVVDGRARLRHVDVGRFGERAAELRGGLVEGARVVLYPGDNVRDGSRVVAERVAR